MVKGNKKKITIGIISVVLIVAIAAISIWLLNSDEKKKEPAVESKSEEVIVEKDIVSQDPIAEEPKQEEKFQVEGTPFPQFYDGGIITFDNTMGESIWISVDGIREGVENEILLYADENLISPDSYCVDHSKKIYIEENQIFVTREDQTKEEVVPFQIDKVVFDSGIYGTITASNDSERFECMIRFENPFVQIIYKDALYLFAGRMEGEDLGDFPLYMSTTWPGRYGEIEATIDSELLNRFLKGDTKATFSCTFEDYRETKVKNLKGTSADIDKLIDLCKFDYEDEPCEMFVEYTMYRRNDVNFLLFKCEPVEYDMGYTFIITEKENGLFITHVQEQYARYYPRFGKGYFTVQGSAGAADSTQEFWKINDDGTAKIVALSDYCGTGWIGEVTSEYQAESYKSSKIDYYSPHFSQRTIELAYALDEGDELSITYTTLEGYDGVLGCVEGDRSEEVTEFMKSAEEDGVTWLERDFLINDMILDLLMVNQMTDRVVWIPYQNE